MDLMWTMQRQARRAARHHHNLDEGVTLIEVVVAFTVLMVALIPLSYLFTSSIIQAGQSTDQQTALSIAEKWVETLSNTTPPVNDFGAVITDSPSAPQGPAPSSSQGTVSGTSVGKALNSITTIVVTSAATFQPTTAANQILTINAGTVAVPNVDYVTYSSFSTSGSTITFTCATNPCSASTDTLTNLADAVTQSTIVTPTETKGNTVYSMTADYSWATPQNSGPASKPNLCTSGTPQLLKLRMKVTWGPNGDANNVQDSVIVNYPPSGVQTLGFIALQLQGNTNAYDTQTPSAPWSSRVQAPTVTISGAEPTFTVNPDSYGCVFAQVQPGSYTVTVGGATLNNPPGTTYGSPGANPFVANAAGSVNATTHIWSEPTSEGNTSPLCGASGTSAAVTVGAVTRLQLLNPQSNCYPAFDQSTTLNLAYPSTSTVEDGVSCPGTTQVTCITTGENGSGAVATWLTGSNWVNASLPAGVTRITSVACPSTSVCIAVGYGTGGGVILHATTTGSPTITTDTLSVPNMSTANASLSQVTCPSPSLCVAIGTTSTGAPVVLTGTIGSPDAWQSDALPGTVTSLSGLVCPSSANGCAAVATTTTVGSPIIVSGPSGTGTWAAWTTPASGPTSFTDSALTQVACTSASPTTCMAIGTGKVNGGASGPIVVSGLAGAGGLAAAVPWSADTLTSTTVTSLGQIICPTATKCLVSGVGTSGASTGALFLYGTTAGPLSSEFPPSSPASIVQTVCPSSGTCMAIGANGSGPVVYNGTINGTATSPDSWALGNVTGSAATALGQVVCSSTTTCVAMGTGPNGSGQPSGYLLSTTDGTNWSPESLPSSDDVLYFDHIDCTSGTSATCAAVGATSNGAVILTTTNGPAGNWTDTTPTGSVPVNSTGTVTTGIPIEINSNSLVSPYTTAVTSGASSNATQLTNLYPVPGGYGLWAGDCQYEASSNGYNVAAPAAQPGGTTNVAVPLGLLSVQVRHTASGLPYAAAPALTIKSATALCTAGETYSLQPAGADGLSRTEVPFGTYGLYVNGTLFGSVVVGGNSVSLTVGASTTTTVPPNPVTATA
jgi:Tfp pilus assembly protein PilV